LRIEEIFISKRIESMLTDTAFGKPLGEVIHNRCNTDCGSPPRDAVGIAANVAKIVRISAIIVLAGLVGVCIWRSLQKPPTPTAVLRVVDAAGQPVRGATIKREGLRTKPGAYRSGWYGWGPEQHVPNPPVVTDANGEAKIDYPKYVFEKVETGVVCLAVEHPDFVSQRPERDVDTSLPENARMRDRVADVFKRITRNQPLIAKPQPIVLEKGGMLKITVPPEFRVAADAPLWGQVSKWNYDTSFWIHPGPGMLATRRLAEGTQAVRVAQFDAKGTGWFSEVTKVFSKAGQTVELTLQMKRGVAVRGKLDEKARRPIVNGRVIVEVFPPGFVGQDDPPHWHSWTAIRPDGSFEFPSLPAGEVEIAAICQGFISTNGPGKYKMHYPQKHVLGTNDLEIVIGMEPTASIEVQVIDQKDQPVANANVAAWPNLRWREWAAVLFGMDLYDTSEWMRGDSHPRDRNKPKFHDFEATTDARGVAIVPNLPLDVTELAVFHDRFQLPAVDAGGNEERAARVELRAGVTNHLKVVVEPITEASKRRHR
jgi:hypothetical protein